MRCPKCGKEGPDQARFCRFCGERLAVEAGAPRILTPEERSRRLLEDAFRFSEEGRLQSAVHACQQAIALNPTSTSAHSLLGTLYERVGDRSSAIREYEQVLTLSPGSTVERRRLNELMGVAAAPERVAVSPRTARMAITGGFIVVALILVSAIVFTTQQQKPGERTVARRGPRPEVTARLAPAAQVAPPRLVSSGRTRPPRLATPRTPRQRAQQVRRPASPSYGQWIAPGTYLLPSGGSDPWGGAARRVQRGTPPFRGAVPIRAAGPVVSTPSWLYPSTVASARGAPVSRLARDLYFQRNYSASIDVYRGYISENPSVPEPREELAWVYTVAGERQSARQEYQVALDQYRADLERGHNIESARHGARTCESAIKALDTQ